MGVGFRTNNPRCQSEGILKGGMMKKMMKMKSFVLFAFLMLSAAMVYVGCGGSKSTTTTTTGTAYKQVERLARPAINEGLVITNDYLNTLNQVGPDVEAAYLGVSGTTALDATTKALVDKIIAEVSAVLNALDGSDAKYTSCMLTAFLPDVMRIDTSAASGYANGFNSLAACTGTDTGGSAFPIPGSPIRGRKLGEDVIDTTLTVLVRGTSAALESDNVGIGTRTFLADFPYLGKPK